MRLTEATLDIQSFDHSAAVGRPDLRTSLHPGFVGAQEHGLLRGRNEIDSSVESNASLRGLVNRNTTARLAGIM